jgi:hypothetical protein
VTTHDILVIHAAATIFLAGEMWTIQRTILMVLQDDAAETWPHHAAIYRNAFRALFWPLVVIEGGSGMLAALTHPAGIPSWLHAVNLVLLLCGWSTIPLARLLVGHHPLERFDPEGFRRFARLNWIRVAVWTVRCGTVLAMVRFAHVAAPGG